MARFARDWRDLARQVQNEKSPHRMVELAQQLLDKLDEQAVRQLAHIPRPRTSRNISFYR